MLAHSTEVASVTQQQPSTVINCAVVLQEGPLAFYKGWLPSVIGVVPYVGLNFGVYETLKHMMLIHYDLRDERELSVPARLGCGAMAGTMGQTVAYPFDVARRRLQVSWNMAWCCLQCRQAQCSVCGTCSETKWHGDLHLMI